MAVESNYPRLALSCLDLTNLDDNCAASDIETLCQRAQTPFGPVAGVCVWPKFVKHAKRLLHGTDVRIVTVVNFPNGMQNIGDVRKTAMQADEDGADEIDMLIPWPEVLEGHDGLVGPTIASVKTAIGPTILKAILETGMLEETNLIKRVALDAIDGGADFVKTSSGKAPIGATPRALQALLGVIKSADRPIGIKPSGGIKSTNEAVNLLEMSEAVMGRGWVSPSTLRIGASGVLDDLISTLNAQEKKGGN